MLTDNRMVAAWVIGLLVIGTLTGMALLVHQYQRGHTLMDARQLVLRLGGGVVALIALACIGALLLTLSPAERPRTFLMTFYTALFCGVTLLVLAILDWRLALLNQLRAEEELNRQMSEAVLPRRDPAAPRGAAILEEP